MQKQHERRMVVEGEEDKFAIVELIGRHTDWSDDKNKAPVWLELGGSADEILAEGYLSAKMNESGTKVLGIVLDADEEFGGRWQRMQQICRGIFQHVPDQMPASGLILQDDAEGHKLGVWIMPDNRGHGMLETFLQGLVRDTALLRYAKSVVQEARRQSAPYKSAHTAKAEIHSWLAWQDPPGQAFGRAITTLTLDSHAQSANLFVAWFLELYSLQRLQRQTPAA